MTEAAASEKKRKRVGALFFLCMNLFYVLLVFLPGYFVYPLGRDYAQLVNDSPESMGEVLFPVLVQAYGDRLHLFHLFNVTLLYGCMVALFILTRLTLRGPWWLSSLAAVLLMANPMKSEAVLQLSGVVDLLPALAALVSLALYAYAAGTARSGALLLPAILLVLNLIPSPHAFIVVIILYELLMVAPEKRRYARVVIILLAGLLSFVNKSGIAPYLAPVESLTALYLMCFPIGLLPATERLFQAQPMAWFAAAGLFLALPLLVAGKFRLKGLAFGLGGAAIYCLTTPPVDFVHMHGGGRLIVPIALMSLGFVALCQRMIQHPKWVRSTVLLTTILCLVFMILQVREVFAWRHASQQVLAFQARTRITAEEHPATPITVAPDYQYYRTAPLMLSESIKYDTPFSRRYDAQAYLPLRYVRPEQLDVHLIKSQLGSIRFSVEDISPESILLDDSQPLLNEKGFVILVPTGGIYADPPHALVPYRNGVVE